MKVLETSLVWTMAKRLAEAWARAWAQQLGWRSVRALARASAFVSAQMLEGLRGWVKLLGVRKRRRS